MWQLRNQLRDLKYNVHEVILDGAEWNTLEHRKRLCMVAVTEGIEFSWADLLRPTLKASRLGEVLEDIPLDAACWSEMGYLKDKAVRDAEQGKGFAMQIVTPDSTKVGTIGKGYQKNRSTEPKVQHPEKPNLLRLLTPKEHAAVKGIPHDLIEGLPATTAHELLGQAVLFQPFKAVAGLIASALKSWANHVSVDSEPLQLKFA